VLDEIRAEPIRAWLESRLTARLRGGRVAEERMMEKEPACA
jgi:hypothetical protein